jgi:hypothetical protein
MGRLMMRMIVMSNPLDLSQLTTQQIKAMLWLLKGTSQAQPLYQELSHRNTKPPIAPDDPDWDAKVDAKLMGQQNKPDLILIPKTAATLDQMQN